MSNRDRRPLRRLLPALLFSLFFFLAGLSPILAQDAATELEVLLPVDFVSFDPNTVPSQPNINVALNVLETLVARDKSPLLATSWEMLDDVTWQFNLRDGVTFSNGEPFNAEAVQFSINRIMDENNENSADLSLFTDVIASVDIVDDLTVNIVTNQPYPDLLNLVKATSILPPGAADSDTFSSQGIGTGPYTVTSWSPGEAMVLTRNPDYWGEAPYFEEVRFRPVPDASVRTTELRAGRADIITQVPIEELSRLEGPEIEVVSIPSTQSMRIHLNAGEPPFDDVRVRQAMNYAIDREIILETLLEGAGRLMATPFGPDIFGYDPSVETYPYDPERARELLTEAGYPDGIDITLQITDGRYVRDRAIGEVLAAQLAEAGIRATMNFSEFSQWLQLFNSDGNGFMVIAQEDNVSTLMGNFYAGNDSFKRYNYVNEQVDALIDEASVTTDEDARLALYQELGQLLHDDAPWVFMWNPEDIYALDATIQGFSPDGVGYFYVKNLSRE